jgi:hypothetical protein
VTRDHRDDQFFFIDQIPVEQRFNLGQIIAESPCRGVQPVAGSTSE